MRGFMKVFQIFLLSLFLVITACKSYNEKELAKEYYPDGKYIKIQDFEIFVIEKNLEALKYQKTPILLVHGFSSNVHTWEFFLKDLEKDYPVIAMDLPGFGFSSKPETTYSRERYVQIIEDIINYYRFDRVILIGNSMGGEISLRFSLIFPDKVEYLVLIDSAGLMEFQDLPWFLEVARNVAVETFSFLFTNRISINYMLKSAFYNPDLVDDKKKNLYYYPLKTKGGINAHKSLLRSKYKKIDISELQKLPVSTLILWGEHDQWIPIKYAYIFKAHIPNSTLVIIPECGHVPQEEKPEESLFYIQKFLKTKL